MNAKIKKLFEQLHTKGNRSQFRELLAKEMSKDLNTTISQRWFGKDPKIPEKHQPLVLELLTKFHDLQKEDDLKKEELLSSKNQ